MEQNYPQIERRKDHVTIEERFNRQDLMLLELKTIILDHIKDEKDLTPVVKELVKTWEAAHWLVNIIKWVGIIAGSIAAFLALLKGTKP
jgi:hypothetical protein